MTPSQPPPLRILISGGGIAGPCVAYWLLRSHPQTPSTPPIHITIVERSATPRNGGQAVDIRDAGVNVIQAMGVEQAIRDMGTTEAGVDVIYADGITKARFPATGDVSSQSFTSEFEVLRGDLAGIFQQKVEELDGGEGRVEWVFDEVVEEVTQQDEDGKVIVRFKNKLGMREFDLVVGADGLISNVRRKVWGHGPGGNEYLDRKGQYISFFTIPREESDNKFAQWYSTSKGRLAVTRPSRFNDTRGLLAVCDSDMSRFDGIAKAMKQGPEKQKEWLATQFEGAGWITERLIKGMRETNDFYIQEMAQVKMGEEGWVKGRVVLCGDAGFCPSPISGMGTTCALVGAYVLAGELSNSPDDIAKALERYQEVLRPFIDQCQKLYPGAPQSMQPQSEWGVRLLNLLITAASNPLAKRVGSILSGIGSTLGGISTMIFSSARWKLPKYSAFE
ncbi:FAD/NAD(P)-binding domain-containing protein [Byssothecium circinans]|uniref:FAD/NAD(P)-binding domain-containing protein n=1 Tax=Byssothecium circinans TaxID=147558 RepID=A0A6A5U7E4_9PLEO|nr:FAD/NAD(P)-binding domain-containing protein [Byssothecium circinans]